MILEFPPEGGGNSNTKSGFSNNKAFVRGSEKISHMSEILGMDFFAYLDAGELPEHFAF